MDSKQIQMIEVHPEPISTALSCPVAQLWSASEGRTDPGDHEQVDMVHLLSQLQTLHKEPHYMWTSDIMASLCSKVGKVVRKPASYQ